jgi:hypothetical protein
MTAIHIRDRVGEWRRDALTLRRYGQDAVAVVLERLADDLEADALSDDEQVSLDQAVHLSGYCKRHLLRLMGEGKLANLGTRKKPAFLLSALPRKPGYIPENKKLAPVKEQPQLSRRKQVARAVVRGD